jgi:preprotein translocase subunit SecB
MKAKFSPLKILDFKLLSSSFEFIPLDSEEVNVDELFSKYLVDIDFTFQESEGDKFFQLMVKISINKTKSALDGYKIYAEGGGVFSIENEPDLDDKTIGNLRYYSSLNMMINNLRNIIYQQSTLGPIGPYLLPPIDIVDLHRQKAIELNSSRK